MTTIIKNREGVEYDIMVKMYLHHCINCGVPFAIPNELDDRLRQEHTSFFCPNGHSQVYKESVQTRLVSQLQNDLAAAKRQINEGQQHEKFWMESWQKKVDENKKIVKEIKQIRKRVQNGVCPCCNRTFQNLAAHMKIKHPEHKPDQL